jgi:hypothetical protein
MLLNYFTYIDTEYKAYILGFIYADGCLIDNINGRQRRLSIEIQEQDGYILNLLGLSTVSRLPYIKIKPKINEMNTQVLNISSNDLVNRLIELGCNINKSKVGMKFPDLPKNLIHHFIRGFFDGDGSVTSTKVKNRYIRKTTIKLSKEFKPKVRKRIYFSSTDQEFLLKLLSYLPIKGKIGLQVKGKNNCYTYCIENQSDIEPVFQYLYKDSTVYLTRKYLKFNMSIKSEAKDTSLERLETT